MFFSLFRYRISGSALLAAMNQSSQVRHPGDESSTYPDENEQTDEPYANLNREMPRINPDSSPSQINDDILGRTDDRIGRGHPTVDVAEILRRWTHALQRIHKQSLLLVLLYSWKIHLEFFNCLEKLNMIL